MSISVDEALLKSMKNDIDMTWEDSAGDEKLSGMIFRGMNKINEICGTEFEYCSDKDGYNSSAYDLLYNYVMYARADALDDFMKNYNSEMNRLQLIQEAINYDKSAETSE